MKNSFFRHTLLAAVATTSLWSCQKQDLPAEPTAASQQAAVEGAAYRLTSYKSEEGIGTDNPVTFTTAYSYRTDGKLDFLQKSSVSLTHGNVSSEPVTYDYSQPGFVISRDPAFPQQGQVKYVLGSGATSDRAEQVQFQILKGLQTNSQTNKYTYNAAGQIVKTDFVGSQTVTQTYAYDANGNRILPSSANSRITATYDLTKLNVRPVPDVLNLFLDKGTESRNLLTQIVEEADPVTTTTGRGRRATTTTVYNTKITTTYTYEYNTAGYVTKKTEDVVALRKGSATSSKKSIHTYTYQQI